MTPDTCLRDSSVVSALVVRISVCIWTTFQLSLPWSGDSPTLHRISCGEAPGQPSQPMKMIKILDLPFVDNNSINPFWVDTMRVSARTDGIASIRCYSMIEGSNYECARIQMSVQYLTTFLDNITKLLSHIPTTEASTGQPVNKPTAKT